ncbi:hypothetical protein M2650_13600 [Luteimonas sp. SX5]|uniref:Tetratricopeptide repeat protein n=1 Tax=Luteimonas galliterrae TaxID=2940486 RepID=A0ABT0ML99_9GAMM|nr:hypothetical protein [Luteimonas galliterrae]MCL1635658.1 hypothetical protein [Luteimonas galliterrae]
MKARNFFLFIAVMMFVIGCAPKSETAGTPGDPYFRRFTPADFKALDREIDQARAEMAAARYRGDRLEAIRIAADIGGMLTSARRESEARTILAAALDEARPYGRTAALGWVLLNLATANQYLDRRSEAGPQFEEALAIARDLDALELEHYTLHHWGRFRVESKDYAGARECFTRALALRVQLNEPRQQSTREALEDLASLERNRP